MVFLIAAITAAVVALFLLVLAIRILREYQRGVIFRLGRLIAQKGPGLILLIPVIDRMVRVDLRTVHWTCHHRRSSPATTSRPG